MREKNGIIWLDEFHHVGENLAYGGKIERLIKECADVRFFGTTGTNYRSDNRYIPFPAVNPEGRFKPFTYLMALEKGYLRQAKFYILNADVITSLDEIEKESSEMMGSLEDKKKFKLTAEDIGKYYETEGILNYLREANKELRQLRANSMDETARPGGIIFVYRQEIAKAFESNEMVHETLGCKPIVVCSDVLESSQRILDFKQSDDAWLVCVNMISEGIDIPRLQVAVYLTIEDTQLILDQRWARCLRRSGPESWDDIATIYVPGTEKIRKFAKEMEEARDIYRGEHNLAPIENDNGAGRLLRDIPKGCTMASWEQERIESGDVERLILRAELEILAKDKPHIPPDMIQEILEAQGRFNDKPAHNKRRIIRDLGRKEREWVGKVAWGHTKVSGGNIGEWMKKLHGELIRRNKEKKKVDIKGFLTRQLIIQEWIDDVNEKYGESRFKKTGL
ncbi:hypothetical protein ES703_114317 [subsurface metagenome]